ncbi:dynein axonemal assembly factor 11 [Neosynchiropus ocellatus]
MVYITEDLIRKRAEHNECEVFSLEEVSLHQQDIEKIEHIERWCRDLKILYLQNNLIPRIENVGRLKKLQYLNLALNNIEVIENLEGCESLQKLDLTVNFVGQLSSVETLRANLHLSELFLVGNPCTDFRSYRSYVVATLPQLQWLDGTRVSRSERIRASQGLDEVRRQVLVQEQDYLRKRAKQREETQRGEAGEGGDPCRTSVENPERNQEEREREFWHTPCVYTPESRLETHRHLEETRKSNDKEEEKKPKRRTLITADGRVMNVNEPKLDFSLTEDDERGLVVLELQVFRHLDTSLLDVDVQPTYARVTVKGKIFQIVLPAEVKPDSSAAQRSQTTGHLLLTMPRADGRVSRTKTVSLAARENRDRCSSSLDRKRETPETLEVDPSCRTTVDLLVVPRQKAREGPLELSRPAPPGPNSEGFLDDPEVPPLM